MIKAVLLDADGVVVRPEKIFSQRMHEEYGVPENELQEFFRGKFQQCLVGKADVKELLADKIEKWGWQGTVGQLLQYWFSNESQTDQRVIDVIKQLKQKGYRVYLATNQEKNRTEYFKTQMGFGKLFDGIFSSAYVGYRKEEPEFFKHVMQNLNVQPEEIVFWDDSARHIASAKSLGIQAYLYKDFNEFSQQLNSLM